MSFAAVSLFTFYLFATISIWLGVVSLRGGLRFARYVRAELAHQYPEFTPFATIFVPCRGVDEGLKENLAAIFSQDYPTFEVIIVSDRADDPALAVVAGASRSFEQQDRPSVRVVVAGEATDSGQKVHNLRVAIDKADPQSLVFAFLDTDARPSSRWLRSLVAPLSGDGIGAATGYRWFVAPGGAAAHLRSVWNASIASALGAQRDKNFCWGGSTAIRRETFERLAVAERWRGTVSDDFTMTRVLHDAALPIKFVPECLTPSFENCSFHELIEFTTRQLRITRAYASHLWKAVLTGSLIFTLAFFGGIALVVSRALMGLSFATPLVLLLIIFAMGATKSYVRLRAVRSVIADRGLLSFAATLAHLTLWPLASLLFLGNALAAISRRITWRGIDYELKSPTETVIIRRES